MIPIAASENTGTHRTGGRGRSQLSAKLASGRRTCSRRATNGTQAARQLGWHVPRDLSVAGFDGIEVGRLVRPRLATVVQPIVEMGRTAGELLLAALGSGRAPRHRLLPYELYRGETIAPHRGGTAP